MREGRGERGDRRYCTSCTYARALGRCVIIPQAYVVHWGVVSGAVYMVHGSPILVGGQRALVGVSRLYTWSTFIYTWSAWVVRLLYPQGPQASARGSFGCYVQSRGVSVFVVQGVAGAEHTGRARGAGSTPTPHPDRVPGGCSHVGAGRWRAYRVVSSPGRRGVSPAVPRPEASGRAARGAAPMPGPVGTSSPVGGGPVCGPRTSPHPTVPVAYSV